MKIAKLPQMVVRAVSAGALMVATMASAQLYPPQNPSGAVPPYRNDAFPYPGQCTSNAGNLYPGSPQLCASALAIPPAPLVTAGTVKPLDPALQPKWQWPVPNPVDYTPDQSKYPGVDYYELAIAPATNMQAAGDLGVFPNPKLAPGLGQTPGTWLPDPNGIPQGSQWTGLVDPVTKKPLYTKAWGFGQINMKGGPLAALAGVVGNDVNPVVVSWPAMNLRGHKGTPVVAKFVNQLGDTHLFCPYPLAWDWPCAIDRTLMGLKARTDPVRALVTNVPTEGVNKFGSPQQPDNAFTIHLHGGEIPPQSDGFSEKWFGNAASGAAYSPAPVFIDPPFESPFGTVAQMQRPGGTDPFQGYDRQTYYYPMVNDEATVWYHDHALGKTRINVAAGPAGFAPIDDLSQQGPGGAYAWLNPLRATQSVNGVKLPLFDLFLAIQDRAYNSDGSINFPNGLGQPVPVPPRAVGMTPVTIGNNPQVHPQWVGEYFADHITVNGVIWPRVSVAQGVYRIRLLDGSNARCYQLGLGTAEPKYASAQSAGNVIRNVGFTVIANEQGYLQSPVVIPANGFLQMCPGERYEILVDFSAFPAGTSIWMSNTANAPFPVGISPQAKGSIFAHTASIIRFDVTATKGVVLTPPATTNSLFTDVKALPFCGTLGPAAVPGSNCYSASRQLYLNERIDPVTLTSLGLQINGVPFEYSVTETPKQGTYERWDIINTTTDFHPMHLHLVKFQIVHRQQFQQAQYMAALCGSNTCQIMGGGAGGTLQVVPDVTPFLQTGPGATLPPAPEESGWKDTAQAPPGWVTSVIAKWDGRWDGASGECAMNFPGVQNYVAGGTYNPLQRLCFEPVYAQPYQWHCHIVDHEDAEMMRTSLVIK